MGRTKRKKQHQIFGQSYLFFFIFITSCSGQDKTNQDSTIESNTILNDTSVKGNQPTNQTYIDPLFFIDGQLCQHVRRIYQDKSGNLWFAAENFGVYRYDGKSFTNFYTKDGLSTNAILSIFEDKEGRFWFGGWGGLFRYDGKSFFSVTKKGPWQ